MATMEERIIVSRAVHDIDNAIATICEFESGLEENDQRFNECEEIIDDLFELMKRLKHVNK